MQTKYFKICSRIFHRGLCIPQELQIQRQKEQLGSLLYLCRRNEESLGFKAEKAAGCKDEVRLVAAGDGSEATIHQLMEFVKRIVWSR